jgi:GntR family transcriptional regulator
VRDGPPEYGESASRRARDADSAGCGPGGSAVSNFMHMATPEARPYASLCLLRLVVVGPAVIKYRCGPGSLTLSTSKTQKIIDDLTNKIESGELAPGDRLPSTAELRAQYGVSITVVRGAVNWLKATGVVKGVPGVGVFVAEWK